MAAFASSGDISGSAAAIAWLGAQRHPDGALDPRDAVLGASITDRLRVGITTPAGTETTYDVPRFEQVNADGSISSSVDAGGGVLRGPNGLAGEWGHNPVPWGEPGEDPPFACYCGQRGCGETLLSGSGLARDHAHVTGHAWLLRSAA